MTNQGERADARPRPDFVVLGIGNPLLSDDGAGLLAMEAVRASPELPEGVRCLDGGTAGPGLLGDVAGCDGLLVLDAVDSGGQAGDVIRLDLRSGVGRPRPRTVHDLGLETLLQDLRLLGQFPERAVLIGLQPALLAVGIGLSPPVSRAVGVLAASALKELASWREASTEWGAAGNAGVNACTEDVR